MRQAGELLLPVHKHRQHRQKLWKLSGLSVLHMLAQLLHKHCMPNSRLNSQQEAQLCGVQLAALPEGTASLREYKLNAQRLSLSRYRWSSQAGQRQRKPLSSDKSICAWAALLCSACTRAAAQANQQHDAPASLAILKSVGLPRLRATGTRFDGHALQRSQARAQAGAHG